MEQENLKKEKKKSGKASASLAGGTQKLHLLFTVVDRSKADFYMDLLQPFDVNLQLFALAEGTAAPDLLQLLKLTSSDKAILMGVIRDDNIKPALSLLKEKFISVRNGKGIAYTIPLDSVIGVRTYRFLSNNRMVIDEKSDVKRKADKN